MRPDWINPWDEKRDQTREQRRICNWAFNYFTGESHKCKTDDQFKMFVKVNNLIQRIDKMFINDLARVKTEKEIALPYQYATMDLQSKVNRLERENAKLKEQLEAIPHSKEIIESVKEISKLIKNIP